MMTIDPREELAQLRDELPGLQADLEANAAETEALAAEIASEQPADSLVVTAEFDDEGLPALLLIEPGTPTSSAYDDDEDDGDPVITPAALAAAILTALRPVIAPRPIERFELPADPTDADLQPLDLGAVRARLRELSAAIDRLADGGEAVGREFGDDFGGFTLTAAGGSVLSLDITDRWLRSTPLTTVGEEIARIARIAIAETRNGDDR